MSAPAMAHDRWRRIEELFDAAIELPPEQRDAFLREQCGTDAQLRREVESLLACDGHEPPLIEGIVDDTTAQLLADDEAERH